MGDLGLPSSSWPKGVCWEPSDFFLGRGCLVLFHRPRGFGRCRTNVERGYVSLEGVCSSGPLLREAGGEGAAGARPRRGWGQPTSFTGVYGEAVIV
jgi:hypothetical protein